MNRRNLLQCALALPGISQASAAPAETCPPRPEKKRVAAVVTEYRFWSHADVICGRLLGGYSANNVWTPSRTQLVSLFTQQIPPNDMSRDLAARHGFKIYPTIRQTLTLGGTSLAVDGVVFVGEHGDYPTNDAGQKLYPRYELFTQILDVYESSGRSAPTFFDKHLSYSWEKADAIYQRCKMLGLVWMAGSSTPLNPREPVLDLALDTPVAEAAGVSGGDPDAYGFHLLESMQSHVERRTGGETGIESVEWIDGDAIWNWLDSDQGQWSKPLLEAALSRQIKPRPVSLRAQAKNPALFVLRYRDGLRAAALMLADDYSINESSVALRVRGRDGIASTLMAAPTERPLPNFDGLVRCIEEMIVTGRAQYPVERTLLTTGALALLFESRCARRPLQTPQLRIAYRAPERAWFQRA